MEVLIFGFIVVGALSLIVGYSIRDTEAAKPRVHRVRRVIGFGIVAAGIGITFLNVSLHPDVNPFAPPVPMHLACGSVWNAMFSNANDVAYDCGSAAVPHLWIAGGVAAVGMVVAFWGAGRGRLLRMVVLVLILTTVITLYGLNAAENRIGRPPLPRWTTWQPAPTW